MSVGMIGALLGLLVAAAEFVFLRMLSARVSLPETKRALHVAGLSQFVLFPVIGYFVAPYIAGE